MSVKHNSSLCRAGIALGLALTLGGCTKGGQFDPTTLFDNEMFDSKTKLKGERVPMFPNGVPGTTTGVPPDLVKGYQAPPDTDETATHAVAEAPKPQPKPKPKVAAEKPPASRPTRIDVGTKAQTPGQPAASSQSIWPGPQQSVPTQQAAQGSQSVWPAPPQNAPAQQTARPSQSIWPNPPAPGTTSQ